MFQLKSMARLYVILAGFFLTACASHLSSPLNESSEPVDVSGQSIGVFMLKVSNQKNTFFQPSVKRMMIKDERKNNSYVINIVDAYLSKDKTFKEYIVSFQLMPGQYLLKDIFAKAGFYPINGKFSIPVYKSLHLPANSLAYYGRIEANVIDRLNEEQLRAGPVLPPIDQAIVGASTGTFDVTIRDNFQDDVRIIRHVYPHVGDSEWLNLTLSPWTQPNREQMQ